MSADLQKKPIRDAVTTINSDGSHYKLYPADVHGRWAVMRRIFGYVLIAIYILLPWIPLNGNPAVLLDVENRRFHFFGLTLLPQDLWVLFFGITGLGFGLFFITALLGRIWCGWACPYTVFLEHIFRRIERLIEGDAVQRKKLASAPWTASKATKQIIKQGLYLIAATTLAHIFLSYFIPLPRLYEFMQQSPLANATAFGIVMFLTGALWFCFGWFREQFCIMMCPYGRLQSALTDEDTIIVGYDELRGEPRGPKGKTEGSCIDCMRCVKVCPTGIDIREGLQMECIGCTSCIDACDDIMRKIKQPTGLIRYDSQRGFARKPRRLLRPRIFVYSLLGLFGLIAFGVTFSLNARPYTADVSRMRGQPFYVDGSLVRNHFQIRLHNKRNQPAHFSVKLLNPPAGFSLSGTSGEIDVEPGGEITRTVIVLVTGKNYTGPTPLRFQILGDPGNVTLTHQFQFLGPNPQSIQESP
ncbi:cytochrome c oxidase accessory protein CcoG [Luteolibacter pohnpeiensis]|uniref:Cytochrome c oxidase accessory protein CcoG n=1 Tax=Luteolibacter pohnpeiensis TaxID=454153 RepID=A0A934S581_9BACT|nr:cytochrome c oxidase accessory protein CcoG [Luteolibacter pohnpeiensis]MBK1882103.1 cytochrome c oxidase accessory protein CcoG [Luteolibacter pohnpeiensis]